MIAILGQSTAPIASSSGFQHGLVEADGALSVRVNALKYDKGGERRSFGGAAAQAVSDNAVSFVYLDAAGALGIAQGGYPDASHIPLAQVVAVSGAISAVIDDRVMITDANTGVVFGQNFASVASLSVSSHADENFQSKVVLSLTDLPTGSYYLSWSYGWNCDSTSRDFEGRIREDGAVVMYHKQEVKESGGTYEGTGSDQRHRAQGDMVRSLDGDVTYTLEFATSRQNTSVSMWDARLTVWRVA